MSTTEAKSPLLKTNLDTDFLKLIAIISMLADHVGSAFFPAYPVFRWIGRLAFPIFCYCLTVGLIYTHDIKKYLGRLAVFAVISQPFYALKADPHNFVENLTNWNIFFTLILSLLFMWGIKTRKWYSILVSVAALLTLGIWNFDYSFTGVILMLIFYLCRNRPALGAALFVLSYLPALWGGSLEDPLSLVVAGHAVNWTIFSVLSAPLIFLSTHMKMKLNKWFFYAFYPAHLAVIAVLKLALSA